MELKDSVSYFETTAGRIGPANVPKYSSALRHIRSFQDHCEDMGLGPVLVLCHVGVVICDASSIA